MGTRMNCSLSVRRVRCQLCVKHVDQKLREQITRAEHKIIIFIFISSLITCELSLHFTNVRYKLLILWTDNSLKITKYVNQNKRILNNKCSWNWLHGNHCSVALQRKPNICDFVYQSRNEPRAASEVCVRLHVERWHRLLQ